jgi:hypothetical protein
MKETLDIKEPTMATAAVNYILNRFMPFLCAGGLLFYACGYNSLVPYAVLGFMWFASRFSFGCGFASAVMEHEFNLYRATILVDDKEEVTEKIEKKKE